MSRIRLEVKMNDTLNLGTVVKNQRNRLGLTLEQLSAKSGVSISHLGRIENAQRYPSPTILSRIAEPLGLDKKELFNLAGYLPEDEFKKSNDMERHKQMAELDFLADRVTADLNRIKAIIRNLHKKS